MPDTYLVVLTVQYPLIQELIVRSKDKDKVALLSETTSSGKLKHLVDLALLSSGMLRGEALSNFVQRSFDMI